MVSELVGFSSYEGGAWGNGGGEEIEAGWGIVVEVQVVMVCVARGTFVTCAATEAPPAVPEVAEDAEPLLAGKEAPGHGQQVPGHGARW